MVSTLRKSYLREGISKFSYFMCEITTPVNCAVLFMQEYCVEIGKKRKKKKKVISITMWPGVVHNPKAPPLYKYLNISLYI